MSETHATSKPDSRNDAVQLYAITNRRLLPGSESRRQAALIDMARHWAKSEIGAIQIREKDLVPEDLGKFTQAVASAVRKESRTTKILLNGPAEIALAAGADGIHLPAGVPLSAAAEARALFARSGREAILSYSCHSVPEVLKIREESQRDPHATTANTLILYAPVFEKVTPEGKLRGQGLEALKAAVHAAKNIPVFALGGITEENVPACLAAGAAGIAGIRLFIESDWKNLL